jgi:sugar phosphate permease
MVLAVVGAPLGGFITDAWRKKQANARLLFPAISTLCTAVVLFVALRLSGNIQYVVLLIMGVLILFFIAGAAAVTQDVIHPGLRATSYAIAVVIQNLLGSSMAPIILGRIYDLSNIQTFVLVIGAILFYLGSRYYVTDIQKVTKIELEVAA